MQSGECSGFRHYANECPNKLRMNKGVNFSLSDDESNEDQESNEGENHTSLTALLEEKRWLHVNPLGVSTDVATPGCNITQKSVCLNETNLHN